MYNDESPRRSPWRLVLIAFITVILLAATGILFAARRYYYQNLEPADVTSTTKVLVTIPAGASLRQISTELKRLSLIRDMRVFEHYVQTRNLQNQLQAGTYDLSKAQGVPTIVKVLTHGDIQMNLITIAPSRRLDQIKKTFLDHGFTASEVERAFDPALYQGHPALAEKPAGASLEGYLYPESFQKTATTTAETIVRQSLDQMASRLTPSLKAQFAARGLTTHQAIILASIVEREVPSSPDRATVAQVFLKRLTIGMNLESDATASYGAILAGQALSSSFSSAYNTYEHGGLPPGPISNVSEVSLQAVANPSATNWIYFFSGDDDKVYFSTTLADHTALARIHCKQKCAPH